MILLGRVEFLKWHDFDHHGFLVDPGGLKLSNRLLGQTLLLCVVVENSGPILLATVHELALVISRVHHPPEPLQQALVGHFLRIIVNLHRFGMACLARGHLLVRGICFFPAGVAGDSFHHTRHPLFVPGLHTPEAAASEGRHGEAGLIRCVFALLRLRLLGSHVSGEQACCRQQRYHRKNTQNLVFHQTSPIRDSIPTG